MTSIADVFADLERSLDGRAQMLATDIAKRSMPSIYAAVAEHGRKLEAGQEIDLEAERDFQHAMSAALCYLRGYCDFTTSLIRFPDLFAEFDRRVAEYTYAIHQHNLGGSNGA